MRGMRTGFRFVLALALALSRPLAAGLPPVPVPAENPITEPKRVLGKILFWDEQLSSDGTVACGTCHRPSAGGADPRMVGDPVDRAFVLADGGANAGAQRRQALVPFDPDRKRLTAAYASDEGVRVVVKGAPEVLFARARQPAAALRTAVDAGGVPGPWGPWLGPTSGSDWYTDPTGAVPIHAAHRDGAADRWVQYQVSLSTSLAPPTVTQVKLSFAPMRSVDLTIDGDGSGIIGTSTNGRGGASSKSVTAGNA
jgi:hypothetical protein